MPDDERGESGKEYHRSGSKKEKDPRLFHVGHLNRDRGRPVAFPLAVAGLDGAHPEMMNPFAQTAHDRSDIGAPVTNPRFRLRE